MVRLFSPLLRESPRWSPRSSGARGGAATRVEPVHGGRGGERRETSPAEVSRTVDLVAYQPGSVVSRIVLKRAAGNVTLFAFAAGQEVSAHTAPYDALVQVLDGEGGG